MLTERSDVRYKSTKTYVHANGLSCCFRQHKAKSHCRYLHGYALQVKITFSGILDENNWVMDFGGLKPIKQYLEDTFDHTFLVAKDDPYLEHFRKLYEHGIANVIQVEATGCEAFARMIFEEVERWLKTHERNQFHNPAIVIQSVEVREHEANSGIVSRKSQS